MEQPTLYNSWTWHPGRSVLCEELAEAKCTSDLNWTAPVKGKLS